jgi:DNA-binding NarL/FixJ family response regulator
MIPVSCNVRGSALFHADAVEVSCVIVDDSVEFLEAARSLLEREGLRVVGVVATACHAVERLRELRPQVVLVDIDLGRESGFEIARRIAKSVPTSVILISTHAEDDFAELIAQSPAAGFISKPKLSAQAIHCLLSGPSGDGASATPGT